MPKGLQSEQVVYVSRQTVKKRWVVFNTKIQKALKHD